MKRRRALTEDEVRKAGRFAYQLTGGDEVPIYNPYRQGFYEIVPWSDALGLYGEHSHSDLEDQSRNWYHLPGCDCLYCTE